MKAKVQFFLILQDTVINHMQIIHRKIYLQSQDSSRNRYVLPGEERGERRVRRSEREGTIDPGLKRAITIRQSARVKKTKKL